MARSSPRPPKQRTTEISVDELLAQATDVADPSKSLYANHARVIISTNEIYIDFYRIEPTHIKPNSMPESLFVQRIILPISIGKGFATALANVIDRHEKKTGQEIPFQRQPTSEDTIEIWKK